MKTVNALKIRNHFGEVLDDLERTGEPILLSKGRKIRAALVPIEEFKRRFVDRLAEEEQRRLLERIRSGRSHRLEDRDSVDVLRELRGYPG